MCCLVSPVVMSTIRVFVCAYVLVYNFYVLLNVQCFLTSDSSSVVTSAKILDWSADRCSDVMAEIVISYFGFV